MSVIVDASMTIAWLFRDERADMPRTVLRRVVAEGANALRKAVRRKRCEAGYVTRSLQRLGRLPITIDPETAVHAWGATRQLSIEHDLTLCDAAYLELAIRRKQPLASTDTALTAAARNLGLDFV